MKTESPAQGSAEEAGSPKSFWSWQIDKNSSEFAMNLGRPVPCEQGAADLWATASSADLRFRFYVLWCFCVGGYALERFWDVSLWVCGLGLGGFVCVFACLRLFAACVFCVIVCDCMFVFLWVC